MSATSSSDQISSNKTTNSNGHIEKFERKSSSIEISERPYETDFNIDESVFDLKNSKIKEEILRILIQYLQDEGYFAASLVLSDEVSAKKVEQKVSSEHRTKMKQAILSGDWTEVKVLCSEIPFKHDKAFLYEVYKQAFLEFVEAKDYERAFKYLRERLKPLEMHAARTNEFKELCYVLTCQSVQTSPLFRLWDGANGTSREQLAAQFESLLSADVRLRPVEVAMPPNRLTTLLRQAVAYQIHASKYHPKLQPKVTTLLNDYTSFVVPNAAKHVFSNGCENAKTLTFVGGAGTTIACAAADNAVCVWSVNNDRKSSENDELKPSTSRRILGHHRARVWQLSSTNNGQYIASASGDSTIKIWNTLAENDRLNCIHTLNGHESDVYTVSYHLDQKHVVSGGYDKTVRLWNVQNGSTRRILRGHNSSVSCAIFNPFGNLIVSGSKDCSIKIWDVVSGLCVNQISSHLGEVTSVALDNRGSLLLSASKDNSNRLWDLRSMKPVQVFKSHQNTSKNYVRAVFGPSEKVVVSGSEDGNVYVWDLETGLPLQKLKGHRGIVYDVQWCERQALLASSGGDGTVRTWFYDSSQFNQSTQ